MRTLLRTALGAALMACLSLAATPIDGTWEGEMDGLKVITLKVRQSGDKVEGTIVFYLIKRFENNEQRSVGGSEQPLVNPRWDGKVLRFGADHTNPASKPKTVEFEVTFAGPRTAKLVRLPNAYEKGTGPLTLTRQDEPRP